MHAPVYYSCFVAQLSSGRRAVSATLAGAVLVLARGFSPEEAWQHIRPVYGTPEENPKAGGPPVGQFEGFEGDRFFL